MAKETLPKVPIKSQFGQARSQTPATGMPNPATLSADISGLFPQGVAAASAAFEQGHLVDGLVSAINVLSAGIAPA